MDEFIGFNDLKVGQRVKVKGKPAEDGAFTALEISVKAPADQAEIEGLIQNLDHQKNTLRIFNREIALPGNIEVKTLQPGAGLKGLKVGDVVKLKGKYSEAKGFVPEKIKLKETMGFNVEELQGDINKIDQEKKTLNVVGFTVVVNEKTTIEGF
jgi:hypothetical protein